MARKAIRLPDPGEGLWASPTHGSDGSGAGPRNRRGSIRLPGPGEGIWSEPLSESGPAPEAPPARALDSVLGMAKEAREAARIARAAARAELSLAERLAGFEQDPARDAGELLLDFEAAAEQARKDHGRGFDGLAREIYEARMTETVERGRKRAEQATLRKTVSQNRMLLDETLSDLGRLAAAAGPEDRDRYARQAEAAIRAQIAGGILDEAGAEVAREWFETARIAGLPQRALLSGSDVSIGSARDVEQFGHPLPVSDRAEPLRRQSAERQSIYGEIVEQPEGAAEHKTTPDDGSGGAAEAAANTAKPHFSVTRGGVLVLVDPTSGETVLAPDGKPFALTERRVSELLELGKQTAAKNLREMSNDEIADIRRFLIVLNDSYLTTRAFRSKSPIEFKKIDQKVTDGAETDGAETDGLETDGLETDGKETGELLPSEVDLWDRLKKAFEDAREFLNDVPPLDPPNTPPPPLRLPGRLKVPGSFQPKH